ncbi:MAG: hypothetical protein R3250_03445 [Melioribacteraceae bacterium]|nr:hypothetical protein [Melioribacteraceae bacterium]
MIRSIAHINATQIAIIFLSIILFSTCDSDSFEEINNPNSREYKKLEVDQEDKELVKIKANSVKERRIFSRFTENVIKSGGKEVLAETIRFDIEGNKKEQYRFNSTSVNVQWLYDYDEYGNLKSIEEYDGYQSLLKRTIYNNRSNGLLLDKREEMKKSNTYYEYNYDDSLNLVSVNLFNNDRVLFSKYLYKYEEKKLDSVILYRNNLVSAKFLFEYDSQGRRKSESIISKQSPARVINYEYDDVGNLVLVDNKRLTKIEYTYNDNGDITEEKIYNSAGDFQSRTTFTYDLETGLLSEKTRYDGLDRPALEIRYEYDFY